MKKIFDFLLACIALCILLLPITIVAVLVKLTSTGPVV